MEPTLERVVTFGDLAALRTITLRGITRDRAKSGTYRAPAVRRVHIPKGSGTETRPLGIPTFEDNVLQRAVAMVLDAVYEQDFYDCSYGFRPNRSAHQALDALASESVRLAGGWILEVDIRKFFDQVDHKHLQEILRKRVHDGVLLRLVGKWLNAGVLEDGSVNYPDMGTPQGGVISALRGFRWWGFGRVSRARAGFAGILRREPGAPRAVRRPPDLALHAA